VVSSAEFYLLQKYSQAMPEAQAHTISYIVYFYATTTTTT